MHPLPNHGFAQMAAQAAVAAERQGRFTEMHELLMQNFRSFQQMATSKATALGLPADQVRSREVQSAIFTDFAVQLGLDLNQFDADLHSEETRQQIAAEVKEVMAVGATGTPASFVNGRYLRGAQPYESFRRLVEQALQGAGGAPASAP